MINEIKQSAEARMKKSIEVLHDELAKLRTGRAHPSFLEHIMVSHYGNDVPLKQIASITISDPRTLLISPWEKNMVQAIEKAILTSDLGLNPATAGTSIRVPLPALTEQRRKDLIKIVKTEAEDSKVGIRNARRDANSQLKDLLKDKKISEDEEHRAQDVIQKLTDKFIIDVDHIVAIKEKDLMEV